MKTETDETPTHFGNGNLTTIINYINGELNTFIINYEKNLSRSIKIITDKRTNLEKSFKLEQM